MVNLLGKDWKVSPVGKTEDILADYRSGDTNIFLDNFAQRDPKRRTDISDFKFPGGWGFAIQGKNNYYSGYISADKSSNKVTRISFNGKITDHIFSASNTEVHDFVEQFRTYYNLPDFNWIVGGWTYASPNGYTLTIRKDKFLDIVLTKLDKKDEIKGSDDKLKFN